MRTILPYLLQPSRAKCEALALPQNDCRLHISCTDVTLLRFLVMAQPRHAMPAQESCLLPVLSTAHSAL